MDKENKGLATLIKYNRTFNNSQYELEHDMIKKRPKLRTTRRFIILYPKIWTAKMASDA